MLMAQVVLKQPCVKVVKEAQALQAVWAAKAVWVAKVAKAVRVAVAVVVVSLKFREAHLSAPFALAPTL